MNTLKTLYFIEFSYFYIKKKRIKMDTNSSLSASQIFHKLSEDASISASAREKLSHLSSSSEKLFTQLDQGTINNDKILSEVCIITGEWRSLIREGSHGMGSDINRLKLFHAFENILDKVKLAIIEKQAQTIKQGEKAKTDETGGRWFGEGMVQIAETATHLARGFLNKASNFVMPKSYQNWIQETRDQFIEFSLKLLQTESEEVTFEHILEGINNWQKFVKEAHTDKETDIRVAEIKKKVEQQTVDSFPTISVADLIEIEESEEEHAAQQSKIKHLQHKIKQDKIEVDQLTDLNYFADGRDVLFPDETASLEKGRLILEKSIDKGSDLPTALGEALQASIAYTLKEQAEAELFLQFIIDSWVYQPVEEIQLETKDAIEFVKGQADDTIKSIQQKMNEGGESVKELGLVAIKQINDKTIEVLEYIELQAIKSEVFALRASKFAAETGKSFLKDTFIEIKNRALTSISHKISPKTIFGDDSSFVETMNNKLGPLLKDEKSKGIVQEKIRKIEKEYTINLQKNLLTIFTVKNLTHLGSVSLISMGNVLQALHASKCKSPNETLRTLREIDNQHPSGNISENLQKKHLTIKEYKQSVEKSVSNLIVRLTSAPVEDKRISGTLFKKWDKFKGGIKGKIVHMFLKHRAHLISNAADQLSEKIQASVASSKKSEVKTQSIKEEDEDIVNLTKVFLIDMLKSPFEVDELSKSLNSLLEAVSQDSDIVFYYMLDKIAQEIKMQLDGAPSNNSQANKSDEDLEVHESVKTLKDVIHSFSNPSETPNPAHQAAILPLQPLIKLLEEQGESDSIRDVTTPIVQSLFPSWREWLEKNPSKDNKKNL